MNDRFCCVVQLARTPAIQALVVKRPLAPLQC